MTWTPERMMMAGMVLGGPILVYLLAIRPQQMKLQRLKARIVQAESQYLESPVFEVLRPEERARLQDPAAPWRRRLRVVNGDVARVAHYHWVVSAWQEASRKCGVPLQDVRSSWDPVKGAFSLPTGTAWDPDLALSSGDTPESKLVGWVLEARVEGGTAQLFRALSGLPAAEPLLEPVGLRWRQFPGEPRRQHLLVRNLVLQP